MRKYKKEEKQYFTEYDPSKFYGVLVDTNCTPKRNVLLATELNGNKFKCIVLEPSLDGYGSNIGYSFEEACNSEKWQVFEFDTRKELLQWLLEEHK